MGPVVGATKLLGTQVTAVVPLQRLSPALVLASSAAEIAALAILIATGSLMAMALLLGTSAVLIGLMATNTRQVLAFTRKGTVRLAASVGGWPTGVLGPVPRDVALPDPSGLGVSVHIGGERWWVDRSSFRFLRRAKVAQAAEADAEADTE
jgi:hypothetical protein